MARVTTRASENKFTKLDFTFWTPNRPPDSDSWNCTGSLLL